MKVKIGPYINHWTTQSAERLWYRLRYKKYDWEVDKRDWLDEIAEGVFDFFRISVCRPVNYINQKRNRKIKVKIDDYDTWSADHTLANIIVPLLKKLKEDKMGAPCTDDEDVPEHLRSTSAKPKENDYDTDEFHFERWYWILDEMIWAFEQTLDEDADMKFSSGEIDHMWQGLDKDGNTVGEPYSLKDRKDDRKEDKNPNIIGYRIVDGPNHTYKIDHDSYSEYRKRVVKGQILFGKYYGGLWT